MYLEEKIIQYEKAINKLEEAIRLEFSEIVRDSAIQRFEICYELAWKTIKQTLEFKGLSPGNSPRDVFRSAFVINLINDESMWLDILSMRNLSTHTYNEILANSLYGHLSAFLVEMRYSLQKIKSETGL